MIVELHYCDVNKIDIEKIYQSNFISEKNKIEIKNFKTKEAQKEKIISFYLKNKYICEYEINYFGKPIAENGISFNVSHSHGFVVLGMINKNIDIGIDVEKNRPVRDGMKKYISSEVEFDKINDELDFYKIWTNKESLLKCTGEGIRYEIKEVPALPFEGIRIFNGKKYNTKIIQIKNYIISITLNTIKNFKLKIIEENFN